MLCFAQMSAMVDMKAPLDTMEFEFLNESGI